jgi:hypothetical protein
LVSDESRADFETRKESRAVGFVQTDKFARLGTEVHVEYDRYTSELLGRENGILSSTQYGLRKGRCTNDCLAFVTTDISTSLEMKDQTVAAFLDVRGAYDNVLIHVLCCVMLDKELPVGPSDSYGTYCGARLLFFMLEALSV